MKKLIKIILPTALCLALIIILKSNVNKILDLYDVEENVLNTNISIVDEKVKTQNNEIEEQPLSNVIEVENIKTEIKNEKQIKNKIITGSSKKTENKSSSKIKNESTAASLNNKSEIDEKIVEEKTKENVENNKNAKEETINITNNTNSIKVVEKTEEKQENEIKCGHSSSEYYNTKAEAIAEYDKIINEWSNKWLDPIDPISDEEYYKNCPDGYEIFSCPYCNKWTINLFY